jgi:uncharacterized protein (DUF2062 family)
MTRAMDGTIHVTGKPSWWQRRIVQPVKQQLTQGISVERITLTIALGVTLGIFPILGSSIILCTVVAWWLKLNQPIIHGVATVSYALQLVLLIPFYRAGEWLFNQPPISLSIPLLFERFFADIPQFLKDYGMTGVRGIIVWAIIAPFFGLIVYYLIRPSVRAIGARLAAKTSTHSPPP